MFRYVLIDNLLKEVKQFWVFLNCNIPLRPFELFAYLDEIAEKVVAKCLRTALQYECRYELYIHIDVDTHSDQSSTNRQRLILNAHALIIQHY